ncbi:ComEA family DNA-binding protein [Mesonia sp. K7]|uniref:ComEA family DNA-binding protein n=1 Tax=Mesonia sp. K7 TaxID=2218606 RepID=UPI000DA814DB|nr:helix-hairpin-helix domain-containing protein [Mesonia sp. K7]PZD78069.1 helix-hairpin-helix domain-containing protein [Mesonia sp. K7]
MKNQSHFELTKSQRNGIFLLLIIIFLILVGIFFIRKVHASSYKEVEADEEIVEIQRKLDSIAREKQKAKVAYTIYPFNPNFITDYKGYQLGMSVEEIDRLHDFRAQDKWVNSKADFQQVTGVSDSLLAEIAPYFKFPEWVSQSRNNYTQQKTNAHKRSYAQKADLNTASQQDLEAVAGIGEVLSVRILRYRTKLGGFIDDSQLKDIYGLNYEAEQNLLNHFTVKTKRTIEKKNINTVSILELTEIPYFDYELARAIVEYRKLHEKITSFEELSKIDDFPSHKIERIKLYLSLN